MAVKLDVAIEVFPIAGRFVIARGAKTEAIVVTVTLRQDPWRGRGECVPYARYGESVESVTAAIESVRADIERGADRRALGRLLPPGAARNALDCAMWDLEAKRAGKRAHELAGIERLAPVTTACTISLGSPEEMRRAAQKAARRPLLKIKLGGKGDVERLLAVRAGAPGAKLIVDANEAWREDDLTAHIEACEKAGVLLIEQPLPAGADAALAGAPRKAAICADESAHGLSSLAALVGRYDAVNVKLDKTGGLTEALAVAGEARRLGLKVMAGCMVGSSLSMAPALLLAQQAEFVDLDGPLLLARDREPGLRYEDSLVYPPPPELWG